MAKITAYRSYKSQLKKNKEWKEKNKSWFQEWREKNRDRLNAKQREWRLTHPENAKAYRIKRWTNVEYKYAAYRRESIRRKIVFALTPRQLRELVNRKCAYCGSSEEIGIDRIDSRIGYEEKNCAPCCWPCNRLKGRFDQNEFVSRCIKIANFSKAQS